MVIITLKGDLHMELTDKEIILHLSKENYKLERENRLLKERQAKLADPKKDLTFFEIILSKKRAKNV